MLCVQWVGWLVGCPASPAVLLISLPQLSMGECTDAAVQRAGSILLTAAAPCYTCLQARHSRAGAKGSPPARHSTRCVEWMPVL